MLVSVIIPIYNVAPYVRACLQSVMQQTYRNMEVLLIDDCGNDESVAIVRGMIGDSDEAYIDGIHYSIIHHDSNKGLSGARNTGIERSKGDWLFFLDSDDTITDNCIELMVSKVSSIPNLDMVMGNISQTGGYQQFCDFLPAGVYSHDLIKYACSYKIYTMAWNKLLRKSFITDNALYFEEGLLHEDVLWNIQMSCCLSKICVIEEKTYNYLIRTNGSIQRDTDYDVNFKHEVSVLVKIMQYIEKKRLVANADLYLYAQKSFYELFFKMLWEEKPECAEYCYHEVRKVRIWTPLKYITHSSIRNIPDFVCSWHQYMPEKIGRKYLIKAWLFMHSHESISDSNQ